MKKRLAFMAVWLLGTVASILLAWSAVSIVGSQVTDDQGGPLSADDVERAISISTLPPATGSSSSSLSTTRVTMAAPLPTTSPTTTTTTAVAPVTVDNASTSPSNSTRPSGGGTIRSETTTPTTPTTDDNGGSGGGGSGSGGGGTTETTVPTQPTAAAPGPLQYFHGNGGNTGMRCAGDAATLAFATPTAGWTMSVHDSGPEKVDVEFNNNADNRSRIIVRCNGGSATAEVKER